MKARAARQGDIADILALARLVRATSAEEVTEIARHVFNDEPLSERSRAASPILTTPYINPDPQPSDPLATSDL